MELALKVLCVSLTFHLLLGAIQVEAKDISHQCPVSKPRR
jgi:hypothetical protein